MAKRKPGYVVHGIRFATKAALSAFCSSVLAKRDLSSDDESFLRSLLDSHPERDLKLGAGVARIFVGPDGYGRSCFWLERADGTRTDWSFRACITPPTHEGEVRSAFRWHVTDQVIEFRDRAFASELSLACAITGVLITSDAAHVDHAPPDTFHALVDRFLSAQCLRIDELSVQPTRDGETDCRLENATVAASWCDFHRSHAVLRIVSKRANLSQGRGRR